MRKLPFRDGLRSESQKVEKSKGQKVEKSKGQKVERSKGQEVSVWSDLLTFQPADLRLMFMDYVIERYLCYALYMHARFSTAFGTPYVEEGTGETLGLLSGMLLHPDTGKVEGFFVRVPALFGSAELYCASPDILNWGTRITVRNADVLAPAEDRIRLRPLLEDDRPILGQKIRTEGGTALGTCRDVQFDTKSMKLTWLFPRNWLRWGTAIPLSEIVEVRSDGIIVRDPPAAEAEPAAKRNPAEALERLQEIADPGIVRPS